jgi:hypothetical protein
MSDERMHPVGDDSAWSESYYFNFVDPQSGLGMFTRMGFRPRNGWADALHVVYLGGERVAFTYGRRDIGMDLTAYDGDLLVGGLEITCEEPFKRWRLSYDGPAQDIADAGVLITRSKARPEGWFTPSRLSMQATFETLTAPHYAGPSGAGGERGHFEQSGRVTGTLSLGDAELSFEGLGVRDKSWGPRNWGGANPGASSGAASAGPRLSTAAAPAPFVNWFSMNFGPDVSLGGSCGRAADGVIRGQGWMQEGSSVGELTDVVIETVYRPDSILHDAVVLTGKSPSGKAIRVEGRMECVCPTKIPFPGGATFVNEGLGRFTMDGQEGTGIAEHWHNVVE